MDNNLGNSNMKDDITLQEFGYMKLDELKDSIFCALRTIRDPEKPSTLEELNVVYADGITIDYKITLNLYMVNIEFNPTVPHCSLAALIGLCIRTKVEKLISKKLKLNIYIKSGAHSTEDEINKQINDKERIAAAMENPNLCILVESCIRERQ